MDASLLKSNGRKHKVKINSIEEARQIICGNDYNSEIETMQLIDGRLLLIQKNRIEYSLEINENATKLAQDDDLIPPSQFISGEVILIDDVDEYEKMPLDQEEV